jgi:primosomal protein N' (replication factor Y)
LHSHLTDAERHWHWRQIADGRVQVVVGARSAVFAPTPNLALIIIDEEHEPSYKQGSSPRYHARDVAEALARRKGATLVLGSASLSMETRDRCERGEYRLVELPERVTGRPMPEVAVVDLGAEFTSGNRSMLSRTLVEALARVHAQGEKAVVFLNRRGFASFLLCRECGFVPACDSCTTSMTYHEVGSRLMCHHCGATRPVPPTCPSCGSAYLRQFGAGTQRVEDELGKLFGDWPVIRMDADTTKGRGDHERLLAAFDRLASGVLLGTQMIAKGLDFPEVTLVGVISADVTLNMPDYRAAERTYQLLEQVAGRAGRGEKPGRVVIQTYWPDHRAIVAAATHDAQLFYQAERQEREALAYPPYGSLANVLLWGRDGAHVAQRASLVAEALARAVPRDWSVLGPSPAPLSRLRGAWRWHALVKAPRDAEIGAVLAEALDSLAPDKSVSLTVDVDPLDLL